MRNSPCASRSGKARVEGVSSRARARGALVLAAVLALAPQWAAAQVLLKMSTTLPPANPVVSQFFEPWAKRVNEAAAGEFQIQVINGPTIANAVNVWERTVSGVVDIGWGIHGAVNLPFPKSTVTSLPLLVKEGELGANGAALWRLYTSGLIADEYKDVRVLALIGTPVQGLSSKQPITSLADMKGLKVRAADKAVADIVSALGGAPISVPAIEVYQALSQGVVSASVAGWVLVGTFKLDEVVREHLEGLPLGAPAGFVVMNRQSYAKLSPKGRQVLDRFTGEGFSREFGEFFEKLAAAMRDRIRTDKTHHFRTLAPAEAARWRQALEQVINQWADRTADGRKILAAYRAELPKEPARK